MNACGSLNDDSVHFGTPQNLHQRNTKGDVADMKIFINPYCLWNTMNSSALQARASYLTVPGRYCPFDITAVIFGIVNMELTQCPPSCARERVTL